MGKESGSVPPHKGGDSTSIKNLWHGLWHHKPRQHSNGKSGREMTRQEFVKRIVIGGAAAYSLFHTDIIDVLVNLFETGSLAAGEIDVNDIASKVPKSLEGEDIPKENKWYRPVTAIVREGLERYHKTEPPLHYTQPSNYLKDVNIAGGIIESIYNNPGNFQDLPGGIVSTGYALTGSNDRPYAMFFAGSASNITSVDKVIELDPGTGIVARIRDVMKEGEYGPGFDVWTACTKGELTDQQRAFITEKLKGWYEGALDYVKKAAGGEQISTSVLFTYFLEQNEGNILPSLWDTATWLKILVRNDPSKGFAFDPTYERAKTATDLFKDEFSPTISANWVVEAVGSIMSSDPNNPDIKILNDVDPNNPYTYPQYKDYMPPNRAGGFYHGWNIIALCLCMDTSLVLRMVAAYEHPWRGGDWGLYTEYGRVKTQADLLIAKQAGDIKSLARKYA